MSEHPEHERLSALIDGDADAEVRAHVEGCEVCRGEVETLRRMRMALSAMDDLAPPAGAWERIAASLPDASPVPTWRNGSAWLRAAAAVLLFAGGLGVGARLGPEWAGGASPGREAEGALRTAAVAEDGAGDAYRAALDRLDSLRAEGPSPEQAYSDPVAAAEHLARLDAVIRATREALHEDPADPAMNDLLFEVVEEREALNEALQLATLEYR